MIDKRKDIEGAKAGSKPKKPYIQKDTVASTQTAEIVYGIGEGENAGLISGLKSIILDGTRVVGANGEVNYNEVKYEERVGLIEQEPLKLIEDTATERTLNLEVTAGNPIVSTFNNADVDKFVVRMSIPQLMQNKDNGDSVATSVSYAIDIAVDGGPFVEVLNHTVSEKITNGYEIEHELDTPEGSVRLVRVRRLTGDSTSQMVANKTYVAGIVEIITAKFTHPALHYVGLTFNAENFNGIPKAVFHYKGRKIQIPTNYNPETRTYTGIWDGTFKVMYSNNPAWVLYDMLTHRRFGLGRRIPNELVDKWELYRIGAYCDEMVPDGKGGLEPRFVCNNLVLNSKEDAYKVIKDMASIFRGQAFWNGTQVITSADIPRDVEYAISMASVKDYSYSGTSRAARHNVIKVQYYDKANEYKAAYEFATDYDSIRELGEINELEIRAFGCDSPGQAQRLARYTLLSEQTETRILTATIALDGMVNMQIGDIFAWSDRLLAGAENGGRVVAVNGLEVTLDRDVTNSALVGDTLYVNTADGKAAIREITAVAGNKITVDQDLPNVEQEFVWVIDSEQLSLLFFRLDSVRVSPVDNVVEITGTQHVNSKFAAVDTETALEAPPFSKIEIDALRAPDNVTLTYNVRVDQGINIADLYVAWGQVKGATRYTVEFRRDQQPWRTLGVVTGLTHTIENVSSGIYEVRVRATDALGNVSPFGFSAALNVDGMVLPPPALASFTAIGELLAIRAKWSFPEGAEASLATVIEYTNQDPAVVGFTSQTMNVTYPQTEYAFNGLGAHTQLWMRGGLMDKYGQVGEMTGWVSAVADANPDQLIDLISGHINEGTLDQVLKEKIDGAVADADSAGVLAASAASLANDAKTAAANAQTTADDAGTAAANAQATATNAANAVAKEVTDRVVAVTAEANARTAAINKEATDRAAALAAQDTALKADSAAKVKALKDEVDPKITSLQNGITQVTTDYKAGDTAVVGQLNAYKTSNDSAVASVLQKAESAVATGATNSSAITAINGQIATINNTKLDASVITGYYTKGQTDAKAAEIAAGKVEEFSASISNEHLQELLIDGDNTAYSDGSLYQVAGFTMREPREVGATYTLRFKMSINRSGSDTTSYIRAYQGGNSALVRNYTEADDTIFEATFTATASSPDNEIRFYHFPNTPSAKAGTSVTIHWASLVKANDDAKAQTQAALDANSTAIQNTNAEVARVDGVATAASNATTALAGRVSTVEGAVATKAEADALTALTTRVGNAEGVNTSQGTAITTLQNTVNHSTTGLATKASTAALTATNSEVTRIDGVVSGHTNQLTQLTSDITAINGTLATKADASALNDIYTKTQVDDKASQIAAGKIEEFNASLKSDITDNIIIGGNSRKVRTPGSYLVAYWRLKEPLNEGTVVTLRYKITYKRAEGDTVTRLTPYFQGTYSQGISAHAITSDVTSGVYEIEAVVGAGQTAVNFAFYLLTSTQSAGVGYNTEVVVEWVEGYVGTNTNLTTIGGEIDANANAILDTQAEVVRVEGRVDSVASDITQLQSDVVTISGNLTQKADTSALNALTTRVTTAEGRIESHGQSITTLNSSVATKNRTYRQAAAPTSGLVVGDLWVNTTAGKNNEMRRWNGSAWDAVTDPRTSANTTAISALETKTTDHEGRLTTYGQDITQLKSDVESVEADVATKASTSALNALTTRVTTAEGNISVNTSSISSINGKVSTLESDTQKAINAAADAQETADIALSDASANAVATQALTASFEASKQSDSLVADYFMTDPNSWRNHYTAVDISQYFKTTTSGKITNTVFRKDTSNPSSCWQYTKTLLPATRAYKISMWVRRSADSTGSAYFTCGWGNGEFPVHTAARYLSSGISLALIPADENWYKVERVWDLSGNATYATLSYGFAVGHSGTTGWWEVQGFKVEAVLTDSDVDSTKVATKAALDSVQSASASADTALASRIDTLTLTVDGKASSQAVSLLEGKVSEVEGNVTSALNRTTALESAVNHSTTGLATKASNSALDSIATRVTAAEGKIENQTTSITNLTNTLTTTTDKANNALPQISSFSSYKVFKNVLNYYYSNSGTSLALVIQTPITFSAKMFKVTIAGYNYSINRSNINLEVSGYAFSGTLILNHGAINHGTFPLSVKLGVRDSKLVIILLRTVQNWAYPQFNVDAEFGYTTAPDAWKDGWSVTPMAEADFAANGITAIITPTTMDMPTEVKANASAVSTLTSTVSDIEGTVSSHTGSITQLNGDLSTVKGTLSNKADVSALNALTTRVTDAEGDITNQATSVTNLESKLTNMTIGGSNLQPGTKDADFSPYNGGVLSTSEGSFKTLIRRVSSGSTTGTRGMNAPSGVVLKAGTEYVISFYARGQFPNYVYMMRSTATGANVSLQIPQPEGFNATTFTKVVFNWTAPADRTDAYMMIARQFTSAGWFEVAELMVQEGNTPTDWQPSALDVPEIDLSEYAKATALNSLQTQVTDIDGTVDAHVTAITNLNTTVGNHTTSINSHTSSINGIRGVHALKIETNGVISGYGLVSELINGQVKSQFGVNADSFFIGAPANNKKPFTVLTSPGIINGVTVPAGTYIDTAFIPNATINVAQINKASIESLSALSANLGSFTSTSADGSKTTISGSKTEVFYPNGQIAVRLGVW